MAGVAGGVRAGECFGELVLVVVARLALDPDDRGVRLLLFGLAVDELRAREELPISRLAGEPRRILLMLLAAADLVPAALLADRVGLPLWLPPLGRAQQRDGVSVVRRLGIDRRLTDVLPAAHRRDARGYVEVEPLLTRRGRQIELQDDREAVAAGLALGVGQEQSAGRPLLGLLGRHVRGHV